MTQDFSMREPHGIEHMESHYMQNEIDMPHTTHAPLTRSLSLSRSRSLALSLSRSRSLARSLSLSLTPQRGGAQAAPGNTQDKGLFTQISSDLLKPPSLKPPIGKGRTWAMPVRWGSYKSLFLLNSGRFFLET